MTLFNGTILRFRSHKLNKNNNNNRLPSKISGWLANPGGKRLKPIEEISQEELNTCLYVSTSLRSKRFRAVSEQKQTEERDSRFWPHEK